METEDRISRATYFYPVGNSKRARQAFTLHLLLLSHLITQISIDYNKVHPADGFGPLDLEALNMAMELMRAEGVVEAPNPPSGRG
jgi:hypothetical protein